MSKKTIDIHFSKDSDEWETPIEFFNFINNIVSFDCDLAATEDNSLLVNYISPEENSLEVDWSKRVKHAGWCNPPYSKCAEFCEKAYKEMHKGVRSLLLIPARTDTRYWHDFCSNANIIFFLKGRLKFSKSKNSAPFPSALVDFNLRKVNQKADAIFWDWRILI